MARVRSGLLVLVFIAFAGGGCQLKRPSSVPSRMIEPQLVDPQLAEPAQQVPKSADATPIRLFDTDARGHIGRRVLHRLPNGELTEDPIWLWSSLPDATSIRQFARK